MTQPTQAAADDSAAPTGGVPARAAGTGVPASDGPASVYSKDYWDQVFEQVRRKPTAMLAIAMLVLLYAVAIYAPLLANDRPWLMEAVDKGAYRSARTSLRPIALNLKGMIRDGQDAFLERQAELKAEREAAGQDVASVVRTWSEALASEAGAISQRVDTMASQMLPEDRALLDEVRAALEHAVALAQAGDPGAVEAAGTLSDLTKRARSELVARDPAADGAAGTEGIELQPVSSRPVLETITRAEVYFMGLWLLLMTWILWNPAVNAVLLGRDRARMRRARRPKFLACLLLPLIAVLAWEPRDASFETAPYKAGLTAGDIEATRVVFVPFAFGFAEQNDGEYFRPPTWHRYAEISEEGYYVTGPRAEALDDLEGFRPPANPVQVRTGEPERNEVMRHALGTDSLGRDLVARMIWGARVSLSVGLVSTLFLLLIGTVLGALAGYYGGWVDIVISRVIEVVQCFPVFFLILIVVALTEQSGVLPIMVIIGLFRWPGVARLVRGEFIRLRGQDFVLASRGLGVPDSRTIFRHVLPNAMGPVLVAATFAVAAGILTESALSFLGFGVQAPIPSWGSLIQESRSAEHWWIQVFPGLLIFLTVVLYNLLGEGVRDALDPRIKKA